MSESPDMRDNVGEAHEAEDKINNLWNEMNNFYLYLPGGFYREFYGKAPEKTEVMDTVDRLLKEEFPDIDPKTTRTILQTEPSKLADSIAESRKIQLETLTKINALFNRMVELGFDKNKIRT